MDNITQDLEQLAVKKIQWFEQQPFRYMMRAVYGGFLLGFGVILLLTLGGYIEQSYVKLLQGITFGVALTMIIVLRMDLFTSNNLIMAIGFYSKRISLTATLKNWLFVWLGNFVGAIIVATLYFFSDLHRGNIAEYTLLIAENKVSGTFVALLCKGILCNVLVCTAVLGGYILKNEVAKILFIFCCILPFITSGFEHSIANMSLLSIAYLIDASVIDFRDMMMNLIPVSIGNIIGGSIIVGGMFWLTKNN